MAIVPPRPDAAFQFDAGYAGRRDDAARVVTSQSGRTGQNGAAIVEGGPDLRAGGRKFSALLAVLAAIAAIVGGVALATGDDLRVPSLDLPRFETPDLGLRPSQPAADTPADAEAAKPPSTADTMLSLPGTPSVEAEPQAPPAAEPSSSEAADAPKA